LTAGIMSARNIEKKAIGTPTRGRFDSFATKIQIPKSDEVSSKTDDDDYDRLSAGDSKESMEATILTKGRGRMGKGKFMKDTLPPMLDTTIVNRRTFRFLSGAGSTIQTTVENLLAIPGMIASVGTTAYTIASTVRVHSIKIWVAAGGLASVYWGAGDGYSKDSSEVSTLPLGITKTGCMVFKPDAKTDLANFWMNAAQASAIAFYMSSTQGSIVDLDMSWTESNAFAPTLIAGYTGMTTGNMYRPGLNGPTGTYVQQSNVPI